MLKVRDEHIYEGKVSLVLRREDLIHPEISGNKYRKLKYNIIEAKRLEHHTLLTFGGAFSNHISATAYAGRLHNMKTVGVIRGEELVDKVESNPTLAFARKCGMDFYFVSRSDYRRKGEPEFIEALRNHYGRFYLLPEGGTNALAIKGCEEILNEPDKAFDYICCSVGTGGTMSGLINNSEASQKILGFPALKGDFIHEDIRNFALQKNWELISKYHFGGYGKINERLVTFINTFKSDHGIPLDPVYTGKMMFGIMNLISKDFFPEGSKILAIHTGGLQGISGMNLRLKKKNLPLLNL